MMEDYSKPAPDNRLSSSTITEGVFIHYRRFKLQYIKCCGKNDWPKERNVYNHCPAFTHGNPDIKIDLTNRTSRNTCRRCRAHPDVIVSSACQNTNTERYPLLLLCPQSG